MKLKDLFDSAIAVGMTKDPRGQDSVARQLEDAKKQYEKLKDDEKEYFDLSALTNPYADSRLLCGTGQEEVDTVLLGIDIEVGELLLAKALRAEGKRVDAVVAHHPEGTAYARLHEVMAMQSDILGRFGVPMGAAEDLLDKRIADVERRLLPVNHTRAVDAAKLLGIPMLCLHTPADNMVASHLQDLFDSKKPARLSDLMDLLMEIPEYKDAKRTGAGPKIILGSPKRTTGRVMVDMTGGTEGAKEIFQSLVTAGINTVVGMHFSDDHRKEAEKSHVNLVVAGHISSDNLGLNLLLDAVMAKAGTRINVLDCSGFRRFTRT